jgi:hypothetical protein
VTQTVLGGCQRDACRRLPLGCANEAPARADVATAWCTPRHDRSKERADRCRDDPEAREDEIS